jgi:hypothetical protein
MFAYIMAVGSKSEWPCEAVRAAEGATHSSKSGRQAVRNSTSVPAVREGSERHLPGLAGIVEILQKRNDVETASRFSARSIETDDVPSTTTPAR